MKTMNLFRRLTSLAAILLLSAGILACNETTTTKPNNLPSVDDVDNFKDYDELETYLAGFFSKSQNGWYSLRGGEAVFDEAVGAVTTTAASGAPSGTDDEVDRTHSVSNDQVEGVRETDTIMTDGYHIYVVSGDKFQMIDADTLDIVYTYAMPDSDWSSIQGMFLDEEHGKVVLIANEYHYDEQKATEDTYYYWYYYRYGTRVVVLDVADPDAVEIERDMFFDNTYLVDARMIGTQVFLVMDNYAINWGYAEDSFIPTYMDSAVSDAEQQLQADHIYYMPNGNYSLSYLMLASFSATDPDAAARVDAYLGSSWQIYMSPSNLYVVMYRYEVDEVTGWYDYLTYVLRFAIEEGNLVFKAIGAVDGSPLNQFSMDEYAGAFRIATTESIARQVTVTVDGDGVVTTEAFPADGTSEEGDETTTRSDDTTERGTWTYISWTWTVENKLFVLDASVDGTMTVLGSILEGLGKPNERIFSVRFNGDVGYVVTFVNTDPLYKLDLSDPTDPTIVGEWIEEGVSDYLHIINDGLMLGVGRQAVTDGGWTRFTGVKISLYDTTGDDPFVTDDYFLESQYSYSPVTYDHKAFMYFVPEGADFWYVAIPIYEYFDNYSVYSQSMYVFKAHYDGTLEYVAKLTHNDDNPVEHYWYCDSIERAVIIGTRIYTVSYSQIRMYDMENEFTPIATTTLNDTAYRYYYWD
ncbi:MAG: beta-propeller domain-containing protein [Candidatus Izemoplasmatales bacterium]